MIEIPNIELGAPIGEGAFGDVYRARHLTFDVDVAVKLIRPADVGPGAEDALKEARLMARLDHPNLLRIFDAGKRGAVLYLVFELMDSSCSNLRSLPADRALDVTMQLLAGLQALHDARVLHRDIKPANCLLRARDQRVKLADLGIAIERATRSYQAADLSGTLPFMAPELFDHPARFGVASDLYALGITLQCLVLDEIPYPRTSRTELMAWILGGTPPELARRRPDLPPPLTGLIERLGARAAADRPASAAAALAQLSSGASPSRVKDSGSDTTLPVVGAWVLGPETATDGNFVHHAVTHLHTGAPGRLTALRAGRPLSEQSPLILASAQRASKLAHRGIGDVIDWGMHENRAYVVTRSHGQSLQAVVKASGPLPELEAVELARALADALDYLHREGLVYQILTPASATLTADAQSAQLAWPVFCVPIGSSSDPSAGTSFNISVPRFAAPESLVRPGRAAAAPSPPPDTAPARIGRYDVVRDLGDATPLPGIQPAVDLYGLGETLYYLLAGKPAFSKTPFLTTLILEKMRGPADVRAAAPATTGPTAQLVSELTAPLAVDRPRSAADVRAQLDRIVERLRS